MAAAHLADTAWVLYYEANPDLAKADQMREQCERGVALREPRDASVNKRGLYVGYP